MAIISNQPAQLTARAGLARAGTARCGVAPGLTRIVTPPSGKISYLTGGGPVSTVAVWTTGKQA